MGINRLEYLCDDDDDDALFNKFPDAIINYAQSIKISRSFTKRLRLFGIQFFKVIPWELNWLDSSAMLTDWIYSHLNRCVVTSLQSQSLHYDYQSRTESDVDRYSNLSVATKQLSCGKLQFYCFHSAQFIFRCKCDEHNKRMDEVLLFDVSSLFDEMRCKQIQPENVVCHIVATTNATAFSRKHFNDCIWYTLLPFARSEASRMEEKIVEERNRNPHENEYFITHREAERFGVFHLCCVCWVYRSHNNSQDKGCALCVRFLSENAEKNNS